MGNGGTGRIFEKCVQVRGRVVGRAGLPVSGRCIGAQILVVEDGPGAHVEKMAQGRSSIGGPCDFGYQLGHRGLGIEAAVAVQDAGEQADDGFRCRHHDVPGSLGHSVRVVFVDDAALVNHEQRVRDRLREEVVEGHGHVTAERQVEVMQRSRRDRQLPGPLRYTPDVGYGKKDAHVLERPAAEGLAAPVGERRTLPARRTSLLSADRSGRRIWHGYFEIPSLALAVRAALGAFAPARIARPAPAIDTANKRSRTPWVPSARCISRLVHCSEGLPRLPACRVSEFAPDSHSVSTRIRSRQRYSDRRCARVTPCMGMMFSAATGSSLNERPRGRNSRDEKSGAATNAGAEKLGGTADQGSANGADWR